MEEHGSSALSAVNNRGRASTTVAWILTAIWITGFVCLFVSKWTVVKTMELNALGDFLAGVMAPVAFFWLVVGYFQQSRELALNTNALNAQQKELANQVLETRLLAQEAAKQAIASEGLLLAQFEAAETPFLPKLKFSREPEKDQRVTFLIQNNGRDIHDVLISSDDYRCIPSTASLSEGEVMRVEMLNGSLSSGMFEIRYNTSTGHTHMEVYSFTGHVVTTRSRRLIRR